MVAAAVLYLRGFLADGPRSQTSWPLWAKVRAQQSTTKAARPRTRRFWPQTSGNNHHFGSKRNVLRDLIRNSERNGDHGLRERVILRGLTKMSRTLMFNPDNWIICIMAMVVHYCFHDHVRSDRKSEDQRGYSAT